MNIIEVGDQKVSICRTTEKGLFVVLVCKIRIFYIVDNFEEYNSLICEQIFFYVKYVI